MAAKNMMHRHFNEMTELKRRQKQDWNQLLKNQEATLGQKENVWGMAADFAKERDEHNQKFNKEKSDLLIKQQKELEELKKIKQHERSDEEMER